jgi:hypothetical protein
MRYITTTCEDGVKSRYADDGAVGHFWLKWMAGPIMARRYGLQYVYNHVIPEYMGTKWNEFLGFDKNELSIGDIPNNIKIIDLQRLSWDSTWNHPVFRKAIMDNPEDNVLFKIAQAQSIEFDWQYYLNNDLREKYDFARQQSPMKSDLNPHTINICLHIRHGDINIKDQPERWISNEQYEFILNQINRFVNNCVIHICSEGEIKDFGNVSKIKNVIFHLKESPFQAFDRMINADIFIPAKSAFSTLACYLNKNIKFVVPFSIYWKNDFPDNDNFWNLIPVYDNYNFDFDKLTKALDNLNV